MASNSYVRVLTFLGFRLLFDQFFLNILFHFLLLFIYFGLILIFVDNIFDLLFFFFVRRQHFF